jgi:hypothetical protein
MPQKKHKPEENEPLCAMGRKRSLVTTVWSA